MTVIGTAAVPVQVATPLVASCALLMLALLESESDQVAFGFMAIKGTGHGGVLTYCNAAANACEFPGGARLWSTVAVSGETNSTSSREQLWPWFPELL